MLWLESLDDDEFGDKDGDDGDRCEGMPGLTTDFHRKDVENEKPKAQANIGDWQELERDGILSHLASVRCWCLV